MADHRPNVYWEDDVLIIRASALGGCVRALVQTGMGIEGEPPPKDLVKRWEQGNVGEPIILAALAEAGWKAMDALEHGKPVDDTGQVAVELSVGAKIKIRCHPDGIHQCYKGRPGTDEFAGVPDWYRSQERRVVEAKALRPSFPRDFPAYLWQMSVEMHGTGLKGLWAYGNKDAEGIVQGCEFVPQDEAPYSLRDIKRRALEIYRGVTASDIPTCDIKQYPCAFYTDPDAACSREMKAVKVSTPAPAGLKLFVEQWQKDKLVADAANVALAASRARLLAKMEESSLTEERYETAGVTLSRVAGKKGSVDPVKLKAAGIDVDQYRKADTKGYWQIALEAKDE